MMIKAQVRRMGHVIRTGGDRLLEKVLYGELKLRKPKKNSQSEHFKDMLKQNFSLCGTLITWKTQPKTDLNGEPLPTMVVRHFEKDRCERLIEKRIKCHAKSSVGS